MVETGSGGGGSGGSVGSRNSSSGQTKMDFTEAQISKNLSATYVSVQLLFMNVTATGGGWTHGGDIGSYNTGKYFNMDLKDADMGNQSLMTIFAICLIIASRNW